jgi:formylglycine-generating enzyme required for sulfatase activity
MGENVHEWCSDWYAKDAYATCPPRMGPASGTRRVARGGSWRHSTRFTRLTARASLDPAFRYNDFGFRVYADAPPKGA